MRTVVLFFLLACTLASGNKDPIFPVEGMVDITDNNFDTYLGPESDGKWFLVYLYTFMCAETVAFRDGLEELGRMVMATGGYKVGAGRANLDIAIMSDKTRVDKVLNANRINVKSATFVLFRPKSLEGVQLYDGPREVEHVVEWVKEKTGHQLWLPSDHEGGGAKVVTKHNHQEVLLDPTKSVFLFMGTPWCRHCTTLKKKYGDIVKAYEPHSDVVIAIMNCEDSANKKLCLETLGANAWPYLVWYDKKDDKQAPGYKGTFYSGEHETLDITQYINEKTGHDRQPGGDLGPSQGTLPELNDLALAFAKKPTEETFNELTSVATAAGSQYQTYVKVATKIRELGTGYVPEERERIAGKIAAGVGWTQRDTLVRRRNVLDAFVKRKEKAELPNNDIADDDEPPQE